jgi:hypothetical protein
MYFKMIKMELPMLPIELMVEYIFTKCDFDTVVGCYLLSCQIKHSFEQLRTLKILSKVIKISDKKIQSFVDYVVYGSVMCGSDLAIRYHSVLLCKASGYKFGNNNLISYGTSNPLDWKIYIAAACEGNSIDNLLILLDHNGKRIYALAYCISSNNITMLNHLLSADKPSDVDMFIMVINSITSHRNDIYSELVGYIDWNKPFIRGNRSDKYCPWIVRGKDTSKFMYLLRVAARSNNLFVTRHLLSEGKSTLQQELVYELYITALDYKGTEVAEWYDNNYGRFLSQNIEFNNIDSYPVEYLVKHECGDYKLFEYILSEGLFIPSKLKFVLKLLKKLSSVERYKYIVNTELNCASRCGNLEMLKIIDEEMPGILDIDRTGYETLGVNVLKWLVLKGYRNFDEKMEQCQISNYGKSQNLIKLVNYLKNGEEISFNYNGKYSICPISYMKSEYDEDDPILLEYSYSDDCSIIV